MKNFIRSFTPALLACFCLNAIALPLTNPSPASLLGDIDGSGYFKPLDTILAIEVHDLFETFLVEGSSFGFFFEGTDVTDSSNLFPIFNSDDTSSDQAVVNFLTGVVYDVENAAIETFFTGSDNIGFYLTLNAVPGDPSIFSDPSLNYGADWFGMFPFIADPNLAMLAFENPATGEVLGLDIISGLEPVSVSEPASVLLIFAGLIGLASTRKPKPSR